MEITGIIAEYNPFHLGHLYQIEKIREQGDSLVIAVMSGSFTQRGEAAVFDKWQRAQCAVASGCDLVLELPFVFACRSAQDFARGAVTLLQRLGIVTQLAFGAESRDLAQLKELAMQMDDPARQRELHERIAAGASYAQALNQVLAADTETTRLMQQPNNILALEYLRSLCRLNHPFKPLLIQRQGAAYHEKALHVPKASATAIRQALYRQEDIPADLLPPATYDLTNQLLYDQLPRMDRLLLPLQVKLLTSRLPELQECYGINEGLENRILAHAKTAASWQELVKGVTSKRYPSSRIARTLLYLLLGLTKRDMEALTTAGPLYARLLAASPQGKKLLRPIKEHGSIPLITKTSQYLTTNKRRGAHDDLTLLEQMLSFDTIATELRELTCQSATDRNDFQQPPLFSNK